jgi:predicted LPLAT superfamily acyltransferase
VAEPKVAWDGRSYGGSLGHRFFMASVVAFGRWPTYVFLAFVIPYYCLIARKAVRASRAYLERRLGPARWPRSLLRTYKHFYEFGLVLVDRFIFYARGDRSFDFAASGWEHIEAALAKGRGAIFLSAHLGAWEMAASVRSRFEHTKLPVPLNVVMFLAPGKRVPSFVEVLERDGDLKVIALNDAGGLPFEVIAALERGEIVAFLGDRVVSDARVRVPFLGAPADFPTGPWQIAAVTGAPVIPVFLLKEGWRRYRFLTLPPVDVVFGSRAERPRVIEEHVKAFGLTLEGLLREHPYEWFNFYDFWAEGL